MPNVTIFVDKELYASMKKQGFINWSAVARIAFRTLVRGLEKGDNPQEQLETKVLKLMLEIMR